MKMQLQLAVTFTAILILSNISFVCMASADNLSAGSLETVSSGDSYPSSEDTRQQEESAIAAPDEAPAFCAHIEYSNQGYHAVGTFTEFLPGTSLVQPLYSLDGETWQICRQMDWNLQWLGCETAEDLKMLQNQRCLFDAHEPLNRYLAGKLDRFYLKLSITLSNGITYETQAATIERGDPQPLPEELSPVANLVHAMLVRQWRPFNCYGQYQITVSADATPEDISALLPDTLPVNVSFIRG